MDGGGHLIEDNRFERVLFFPDRKSTGLKQVQAALAKPEDSVTTMETLKDKSVAMQGLGALEFVAGFYPSPGAKSEYLYNYVALCDLPDGVEGVFGVESEAEDIRGHLIDFAEFIGMVSSGEIENGPLLVTALWLQRERGRLRGM